MNEQEYKLNELIDLFIEGETDDSQREALFSELSANPELQKQLQSGIKIRNIASEEFNDTTIPTQLTNSLFDKVGIGSAISTAPNILVQSGAISLKLMKFIMPALSAAFGAFMMYFLVNDGNNIQIDSVKSGDINASAPIVSSVNSDMSESNIIEKPILKRARIGRNKVSNGISNVDADVSQNHEEFAQINPAAADIKKNPMQIVIPNRYFENRFINNQPIEIESEISGFNYEWLRNFGIKVGGLANLRLFPNRQIDKSNSYPLKDLIFGITYNINDFTMIGLETSTESFPIFIEDNTGVMSYFPSIAWLGISLKQSYDVIGTSLMPYTTVMAGGTVSGPIFKAGLGLQWLPDSKVKFTFGIDGTELIFQNGGVWDDAGKIGVVYSAEIRF